MNYLLSPAQGIGGAMLGVLFLACFFIVCLISVLGVKSIVIAVKRRFPTPTPPPEQPEPVKKPRRKPVRSIEIDPDQIDRIVVKKGD